MRITKSQSQLSASGSVFLSVKAFLPRLVMNKLKIQPEADRNKTRDGVFKAEYIDFIQLLVWFNHYCKIYKA